MQNDMHFCYAAKKIFGGNAMPKLSITDRIAVIVIIISILAGCLILALGIGDKNDYGDMAQINNKIDELVNERKIYEAELKKLEESFAENVKGIATEELVVTETNSRLYSELYPLMQKYSFVAEIAVDKNLFEELPGNITLVQLKEILNSGWSVCFKYNGYEDLKAWIEEMRGLFTRNGLPIPEAVYFSQGVYKSEYDAVLAQCGITMAIHHGEENLPIMVTEPEDGAIWHIGARPWNGDSIRNVIGNLLNEGANVVFEVNFQSGDAQFDSLGFREMLNYVEDFIKKGELQMTTFHGARNIQHESGLKKAQYEAENGAALEEMKSKIDSINREIKALYSE